MEKKLSNFIRRQFPSLGREVEGNTIAYLDGPGGYQVPKRVIDAMDQYLITMNANIEGAFLTSRKTDQMLNNSRRAFGDFFNCSWEEVAFGANMTTLNFALSQALMREMKVGDKVIITEMDHEANRGPWEQLQERGIIVEEVVMNPDTCTLDMEDFKRKLTPNTKVVAFVYASNAVGTINDVKRIVEMSHEVDAYTVVDAVHYAAHGPIDVRELETDFLLCSAYKFFGPHIGIFYIQKDVFNKLRTFKVRPQKDYPPYKIETGTLNHEGIAGAAEAIDFVSEIGEKFGSEFQNEIKDVNDRRRKVMAGLRVFESYEQPLTEYLIDELSQIEEITIYGPPEGHPRTSTVSFTYDGYTSRQVAEYLGDKGLFVWDGDFYATRLIERLGLQDRGGVVRIGISPYNTKEELTRVIEALKNW